MASYRGFASVKVNIKGLEDVMKKLDEVEPKVSRALFRPALNRVGKFWVAEMKGHVPVDSGDLKDSIIARVKTTKSASGKGIQGVVEVGPGYDPNYTPSSGKNPSSTTQNPGVYGMFVEFGLKKKRYRKHPFARPTFDTTSEQAEKVFGDVLRDGFERAMKE